MIYAIRQNGNMRTLVEIPSRKHLKPDMEHVRPSYAHKWVRDGKLHETGLFMHEGRIRYAPPQN